MSFLFFPLECCYLVIDITPFNGFLMEQMVSINCVIQPAAWCESNRFIPVFCNFCQKNKLCKKMEINAEHQIQSYCNCILDDYCNCAYNFGHERKEVKRRVRKSTQLNIEEKVLHILRQILSNRLHSEYFMRKAPEKDRNYTLKRSSKYIGVSMNGNNWQAMINNGSGKKYIGTYATEKEAAVAYDFYSFALHDCNHQTNFDYNVETVEEMIESFLEHDKILIPSLFIDKALN